MQPAQSSLIPLLIAVVVVLPLLYFRMRKMAKEQPLKLQALLIRPVIYIGIAAVVLTTNPPAISDIPWLLLAGLLGSAAGWQWGRTMAIHVHPEDGTLMVKGSQAAMLVLIGLVVLRMGLRTGLQMEAQAWHISLALITDGFILFAAFMFAVRGLEMFLRARRVMAVARPS